MSDKLTEKTVPEKLEVTNTYAISPEEGRENLEKVKEVLSELRSRHPDYLYLQIMLWTV